MGEPDEDPFRETRMSLGEHLEELRSRLFKGLAAIFVAFVLAWVFRDTIAELVLRPYDQAMAMLESHWVEQAEEILRAEPERPRTDLFQSADPTDQRLAGFDKRALATGAGESFFFVLKICLYFAVFIGSPVLLYQMWRFVSAGLYKGERRAVVRYFPVSLVLFVVGVLFGYFVMVPYAMYFLNRSVPLTLVVPDIKLESFLSFLSSLCLAFGAVFQLPVILTFLGVAGIVDPADMARYRSHFIVGAFVIAAILTPPDPFTQLLMGIPLIVLYEIGIWSARFALRSRPAAVTASEGSS